MAVPLGQMTVEPELQGRTPRRTRYTGGTQTARFLVWLLFLGGLGLVGGCARHDLSQLGALRAHGETTTGHITDRHVSHGKHDTYYLDYMFMTDKGVVSDDEEVPHQDYSDTRDGTPLTVTYLPADPDIHRVGVVNDRYIHNSINMWLGGAAFAAFILGLIVFFTERNYRSHRTLLENGIAVIGHITDRKITQGSKSTYYYVLYEFYGPGGTISGKVCVSQKDYNQASPGTAVTVLYNPARTNNNRPYSLLTDVRLA